MLTDFDGVWTDPTAEALAQGEILEERLLALVLAPERVRAEAWLEAARRAVAREPRHWGWRSAGRLSAFGDEDPFIAHAALLAFVEDRAVREPHDPIASALVECVRAQGFTSLDALNERAHALGVEREERARGPAVLPAAAAAGRALLARGHEIVAVSNSPPEKLMRGLAHTAVPHTTHPARAPRAVRVRASARKFELGSAVERVLALEGVAIALDRPCYAEILLEERPGAVVGDVFSLDLALPLALRRSERGFGELRLLWLIHPYTPEWLERAVRAAAPEVELVPGGLAGVAARI